MTGITMINKLNKDRSFLALLYMIIPMAASFLFLSKAMDELPMGTAYAVWTGIGACGSTILGMLFFREPADWKRMLCLFIIIFATVGLKLSS